MTATRLTPGAIFRSRSSNFALRPAHVWILSRAASKAIFGCDGLRGGSFCGCNAGRRGGGGRTRTYEGVSQRIYSPPPLPLGTLPRNDALIRATVKRRYRRYNEIGVGPASLSRVVTRVSRLRLAARPCDRATRCGTGAAKVKKSSKIRRNFTLNRQRPQTRINPIFSLLFKLILDPGARLARYGGRQGPSTTNKIELGKASP